MQVQDSLVDAHLEAIIGVGTLTARGLSDHESENLGGHTDGAGHLEVTSDSLALQIGTHFK